VIVLTTMVLYRVGHGEGEAGTVERLAWAMAGAMRTHLATTNSFEAFLVFTLNNFVHSINF